jgi:hypothetical protein
MDPPKHKGILIGCPQYGILVRGTYDCDGQGSYLRGHDGQFLLEHAHCGQYSGRCMQTLCVLHRYNRRGAGSWFPSGIYALREGAQPGRRHGRAAGSGEGWYV